MSVKKVPSLFCSLPKFSGRHPQWSYEYTICRHSVTHHMWLHVKFTCESIYKSHVSALWLTCEFSTKLHVSHVQFSWIHAEAPTDRVRYIWDNSGCSWLSSMCMINSVVSVFPKEMAALLDARTGLQNNHWGGVCEDVVPPYLLEFWYSGAKWWEMVPSLISRILFGTAVAQLVRFMEQAGFC